MPTIEVDEEEVRSNRALRNTVAALWSNPKARIKIQEAQKLVDPNAKTPDLDQATAIMTPVEEVRKEFREYIEKTEGEKAKEKQEQRLAQLQAQRQTGLSKLKSDGWTDDGIKGVEALMEEKGLLDPLDAAAIFEKSHPPQQPNNPSTGTGAWNFMDLPSDDTTGDLKKLVESKGDNDILADRMAWNAINEVRGAPRR